MKKKRKSKASKLWGIIAVILLLASLTLLLYPTISKALNKQRAATTINGFNEIIEKVKEKPNTETFTTGDATEESKSGGENRKSNQAEKTENDSADPDDTEYIAYTSDYMLTQKDIDDLCLDSQKYNDALKTRQSFDEIDFSMAALNLPDYGIYSGIYGYISIPDIDLQMPILLGATKYNMACGVTHLYGTSLPGGGESTNCVLAGHTGATGRIFFDDIPYLQYGSIITVTTFFGEQTYEVADIKKIDITQTNDLYIEEGKDKLTLLTCADSGTRRWQVSCYRKQNTNP